MPIIEDYSYINKISKFKGQVWTFHFIITQNYILKFTQSDIMWLATIYVHTSCIASYSATLKVLESNFHVVI